jgi:SAM-dependent methyltransferase/energy-coupling factor transporter ATP-binding protein EcfA2
MKISSFEPSVEKIESCGLKKVRFSKLSPLVVLSGPNGGGKSRILRLLRESANAESNRIVARRQYDERFAQYDSLLKLNKSGTRNDAPEKLLEWERELVGAKNGLQRLNEITMEVEVAQIHVVNFVPKELALASPGKISKDSLIAVAQRATQPGVDSMHKSALAYIQRLQDRNWEATHPGFRGNQTEKTEAITSYQSLASLVEAVLDAPLGRTLDGETTIFGRPLGESSLSDGQAVLVQLLVAVHPVHSDEDVLILMDEPENHLHPSSSIFVFEKIRAAFPHAQMWVATHSVPLIAYLHSQDPDCLHYVYEGSVEFAGTKPQMVLEGLLGDESNRQRLLNFLDLPRKLATLQFSAECILAPKVADFLSTDPQLVQIHRALKEVKRPDSQLRILDYGAGKARLLSALMSNSPDFANDFAYVAFEPNSSERKLCEMEIKRAFGSSANRCFGDPDDLLASAGSETFDVVVLCNVLHELHPDSWLELLGENGLITKSLRPTGYLLLVEDLRLPHGELPNASGFFLLDTLHVQQLFGVATPDEISKLMVRDQRGDGRLKAHLVPREFVSRATGESSIKAIRALRESAMRKLKETRNIADASYKTGQLHGLWSQLYANCALYLDRN